MNNKKEQERAELHRTIWGIANILRGSVDGWDFKQYVLGMLFYRYISENLTNYINKGEVEAGNTDFDYSLLSDEDAIVAKEQLKNAKEELKKPFEKAEELKTKVLRLAELNKLLDMGEVEEKENPNPLLEDVKRAIVDFCKREYEDDSYNYENFNNLFPDLAHIGIAYTTTPDEKHEIQYEISLEDFTATQYINGEPVTKIDYLKDLGSEEKVLEFLKQEMEYGDFGEFVSIDDNDLKKALGLERDDNGNIYDPLAKDLDNDGVADRYDNDFRYSDYFETTYDVEDNLNARAESKEKVSEKPSILGQIKSYQSQEKQAETRENKSKEHDER